MAEDDKLYKYALQVRARAIRRVGELLQTFEKSRGGRPTQKTRGGTSPSSTCTSAVRDAGLSDDQRKTALRVASLPEEDFEAAVESDTPPTISVRAEQGTKKYKTPAEILGDCNPADFRSATQAVTLSSYSQECSPAPGSNPLSRHTIPTSKKRLWRKRMGALSVPALLNSHTSPHRAVSVGGAVVASTRATSDNLVVCHLMT